MVNRFERFSFAMTEISRHWHKLTSDEMSRYGLKGTHSIYLLTLYRNPQGLTAPQLCELCDRDKADVSRMMAIMEEKGLATKEFSAGSKYRGTFRLTPEGMEAAEYISSRVALAVQLAGKDLSEDDRKIFYDSLESILKNLRNLSHNGIPDNKGE